LSKVIGPYIFIQNLLPNRLKHPWIKKWLGRSRMCQIGPSRTYTKIYGNAKVLTSSS